MNDLIDDYTQIGPGILTSSDGVFRTYRTEDNIEWVEYSYTEQRVYLGLTEKAARQFKWNGQNRITSGQEGFLGNYFMASADDVPTVWQSGAFGMERKVTYAYSENNRTIKSYEAVRTVETICKIVAQNASGGFSGTAPAVNNTGGIVSFPHSITITRPAGATRMTIAMVDMRGVAVDAVITDTDNSTHTISGINKPRIIFATAYIPADGETPRVMYPGRLIFVDSAS